MNRDFWPRRDWEWFWFWRGCFVATAALTTVWVIVASIRGWTL